MADVSSPNLEEGKMAWIEVSPKAVEHFHNPAVAKDIMENTGYFIYQNVKCYIQGKREMADKRDGRTCEEMVFGVK